MAKADTAIFGIGCTSLSAASETYMRWLKSKSHALPVVTYVGPGSNLKASTGQRLVMVEGVATLFHILPALSPNDRVLVADSPVLLGEVPTLTLLDLEQQPTALWSYHVVPFSPQVFYKLLTKSFTKPADFKGLGWTRIDQLGLIINETSSGKLVTPIKAVTSQLDHTTRPKFRMEVGLWAQGQRTPDQLDAWLLKQLGDAPLAALLRRNLKAVLVSNQERMVKIIELLKVNRSVNRLLEGSELTLFECKFLYRMIKAE